MLTTSPLGADWRPAVPPTDSSSAEFKIYYDDYEIKAGLGGFTKYPDPREMPSQTAAEGYFLLKVEYAPTKAEPLSKYIKITSVGHSLRNPMLLRTLVAYKPIGITEYIRFVTNADRSGRDNDWGIPPWIDYNNDGTNDEQYTVGTPPVPTPDSIYNPDDRSAITNLYGPVRFQGDVFFRGANQFYLWPTDSTKYRNDKMEFGGDLNYSTVDKSIGTIVEFYNQSASSVSEQVPIYNIPSGEKPAAFTYDYPLGSGNFLLRRGVRRITPPDLSTKEPATGLKRYEALTKRSGVWIKVNGKDKNTGEYGYEAGVTGGKVFGAGIYVNNSKKDIQFSSDPEKLRLENLRAQLLRPSDIGVGKWNAGVYDPPGLKIELKPGKPDSGTGKYPATWDPANPNCPKIVFARDDDQFKAAVWDPTANGGAGGYGEQDVGTSLELPYPRDGVLYCTGNARISGALPQRDCTPANADYTIENLTVVSEATIYIDGSLLTPQGSNPNLPAVNRSYIGLLARDMVVLNPTLSGKTGGGSTAITLNGDVSLQADATGSSKTHYEIRPGGSFVLRQKVINPLSDPTLLTLRHCGADPGPTVINVIINGQYFDFQDSDPSNGLQQGQYTFTSSPSVTPDNTTTSNHLSPNFETKSWDITAYLNRNTNDVNYITIQLDSSSSTSYWLGGYKLNGEIHVNALAYAQNGSWFVIPGQYCPNYVGVGNPTGDDAVQNMRYNTPIYFRGAIAESHPADSPAVADWVKKWSYPFWLPGDDPEKPHWGTIRYEFDDDLINNRRGALPILPALPVSPDLIYEGEE
jgi:hypothetical protein